MGKTLWLAMIVSFVSFVLTPPAYAQIAGGPPPPDYEAKGDGTLVIEGDVRIRCDQVGAFYDPSEAGDPVARSEAELSRKEATRACQEAGFATATGSATANASESSAGASARAGAALPETGGPALPALVLCVGTTVAACGLWVRSGARRVDTRRLRRGP